MTIRPSRSSIIGEAHDHRQHATDVGLTAPDTTKAYTFSGGRLRFTFTDPTNGLTYRSNLILTPTDAARPIWVEDPRTLVTTPPADVDPNALDPFPDVPVSATTG